MGSSNSTPAAPDPGKSYASGIQAYLQYLPQLLGSEQDARTQYDPQRIAEQQALQSIFGPQQYQQQLNALNQIDPLGQQVRTDLGNQVGSELTNPQNNDVYNKLHSDILSGLNSGSSLTPTQTAQFNEAERGAQAARGNIYGGAAQADEVYGKTQAGLALYNQRQAQAGSFLGLKSPEQNAQDNAGQFLGLATPEQQLLSIQGVSPDRSSAYSNPNAGYQGQQFALGNYQNLLAQQQASAGANPWTRAASGAAAGASAGSAAGGWGALAGGVIGGVGGYLSGNH